MMSTTQVNLHKFDSGFYEKLQRIQHDCRYAAGYQLILITPDQVGLVDDLRERYGAGGVFHPQFLSNAVTASVPIDRIAELSLDPNVVKIGDGGLRLSRN